MKRFAATLIAFTIAAVLCGAAPFASADGAGFLNFNIALFSDQQVSAPSCGFLDFNISAFSRQRVSGPSYGCGNVNVSAFSSQHVPGLSCGVGNVNVSAFSCQRVGPSDHHGVCGIPHYGCATVCAPVVRVCPPVCTQTTYCVSAPASAPAPAPASSPAPAPSVTYQYSYYQSGYGYGGTSVTYNSALAPRPAWVGPPAVAVNVWR